MSKKYILSIMMAISCILPLQAGPKTGGEIVKEATESFHKGEYQTFLKGLHEQYEAAGKAGLLKTIFEKMKAAPSNPIDLAKLTQRNQKLVEAVKDHPDSAISGLAHQMAQLSFTSDQEAALSALQGLRFDLPENAPTGLRDKMAGIETEYRLKLALFEIASEKSGSDFETRVKKKIALEFEKLEKMEKVAQAAKDPAWMLFLKHAKEATETKLVQQLDWNALRDLAKTTPIEEKVLAILSESN